MLQVKIQNTGYLFHLYIYFSFSNGGKMKNHNIIVTNPKKSAKTSVSPRSSPLGTFRVEERLRLSDRNSILMTQINVYLINPVVVGFQM